MAILQPDKTMTWNGLKVNEYLLTNHNSNGIDMPTVNLPKTPLGITVHNTAAISTSSNTTMAEQYTRATKNGNMGDVRVHFYVDNYCAWQNLPLTLSSWHAADGSGPGNRKTISIEVIGDSSQAEQNAAKLIGYLMKKFNFNVEDNLFTHTHWLNVQAGRTGNNDYLNTTRLEGAKYCPIYILPHWDNFKKAVSAQLSKSTSINLSSNETNSTSTPSIYRVRKSWENSGSQIGAYNSLENAKKACPQGYAVFNEKGEKVSENLVQSYTSSVNVRYRAFSNSKWWDEVINYNETDSNGYAGVEGYSVKGFAAKSDKGNLKYRVHIKNGGWLSWITKYDTSNWINGCAGNKTKEIDAIQITLENLPNYEVKYRVSTVNSDQYLNWITDYNTKNSMGYAGIFGQSIDKIQIKIESKY